jgi:hypothetical protein
MHLLWFFFFLTYLRSFKVTRAMNSTRFMIHTAGTKVFTDAQAVAGIGWMGLPLGPATYQPLTTPNLVSNPNFYSANSSLPSEWYYTADSNSTVELDKSGSEINQVSEGTAAKFTTTGLGASWDNILKTDVHNLVVNATYTLSAYARSTHNTQVAFAIYARMPVGPSWLNYTTEMVPAYWQRNDLVFTVRHTNGLRNF